MSNNTHHAPMSPESHQPHGYGDWPTDIFDHKHDSHVDDPELTHQRHEGSSFIDARDIRNPRSLADSIKARIVAAQAAQEIGLLDHEAIREAQQAAAIVEAGQHIGHLRIEARSTDMPLQTYETTPLQPAEVDPNHAFLNDTNDGFSAPDWMRQDNYDLVA